MIVEDQSAILDWLQRPSTHGGAAVERIDTHSAAVFLAGSRALKLKRAVRYDYLDFSTADRRRACCEAEVALNRRTAPSLYRGVVAITRAADGGLQLGGGGTPVDWLVDMVRFDQALLLDRLAQAGRLGLELMEPLAVAVAAMHAAAPARPNGGGYGAMRRVAAGNADGLAEFGGDFLDAALRERVAERVGAALDRVAYRLEQRRIGGRVRQCHGDLHLGNVVLLDGEPTPFDAIEFNDEIADVDVVYDIAFLLMDLWHRGLTAHANFLWNTYLRQTGDWQGVRFLPLFLSCRALVRAKTLLTAAAEQPGADAAAGWRHDAVTYVELADRLLAPGERRLIAIGGLSGSGKTTVARRLAPHVGGAPGAVLVRSDEVRKQLAGVPMLRRLPPEAYSPGMAARVYAEMYRRAEAVLQAGGSAILDATFLMTTDRDNAESTAGGVLAPFTGLWLDAPSEMRADRVTTRRHDASDADASVARAQGDGPADDIGWQRVDAGGTIDDVVARAAAATDAARLSVPGRAGG